MSSFSQLLRSTWNSVAQKKAVGRRRRVSCIFATVDQLESRRLLATLVSTTKISYQDIDGDNVTVTLSKPILTNQTIADTVFKFNTGSVNGLNATRQQLRSIKLASIPGAAGTTITTVAVRSLVTGGDGFAALGQIDATGRDLGAVTIDGDLARIVAGDASTITPAVGAVKVQSMGRYGTMSGAADLSSVITGPLTSLTVKGDIKGSFISVVSSVPANGKIGAVTIGGSLIGGAGTSSGAISSVGAIASVTIGGDVHGGAGASSGRIRGATLPSVTIGGSLSGGSALNSGTIEANAIGTVKVGGNVRGGFWSSTGAITATTTLAGVTIGGSLVGGQANSSGTVTAGISMGAVSIARNVVGGDGNNSGRIYSPGTITSVTVGGSLIGHGNYSGSIQSGVYTGIVSIAGNMQGGPGAESGRVGSEKLGKITIGGSVFGGGGNQSGEIRGASELGESLSQATSLEPTVIRVARFLARLLPAWRSVDRSAAAMEITADASLDKRSDR